MKTLDTRRIEVSLGSMPSHPSPSAATWAVHTSSAWISPSSRLRIPVPCVANECRFLLIEFNVKANGRTLSQHVDFDVMFEGENGEDAQRLYGPSRRTTGVSSCLPLPSTGCAHVTFDNSSAWMQSVELAYTMMLSAEAPEDARTVSKLIAGRTLLTNPSAGVKATSDMPDSAGDEVDQDLAGLAAVHLHVAPGAVETVMRDVAAGSRVVVHFDVVQGSVSKYDIDFGIMFLPDADGDVDDEPDPIRLFGPCRRATTLAASVVAPAPGRAVLSFDNSGMWFSSKALRYRCTVVNDAEMY